MTEPRLGDKMGDRYRLLELIGRGGMGSVYQARDEVLWRDVALKLFDASTEIKDVQRQEDEINVLAGLNHHGLVTLLDAAIDRTDESRPRIYFVMELVQGTDLEKRLQGSPLTARQIAQIGFDVAEGLQYIHHRGVVHRDVKPSNVLIVDYHNDNTRARAKLTDFGIALVQRNLRVTGEGMTTGTAAYLSPEQVSKQEVGPPSDIYSLGLVLLECFTHRLAFEGEAVQSALSRLQHDPDIPSFLSEEWRSLLHAMTALDPANRPDSNELVLLLRQAVISETGRHRFIESPGRSLESQRLEAVRRLEALGASSTDALDRIVAIAARVIGTPVAFVSLVGERRIRFISRTGMDLEEVDREDGLCASAIQAEGPWIVEDARTDPRTMDNSFVTGEFGLQFYAGVPITTDGLNVGTLCVVDFEPRSISDSEIATLTDLAAVAMRELELRPKEDPQVSVESVD